uniref:Ankyrin repeat and SOCS box containing 2b n=1 Tax=Hucho hucho TaxID=62062 RepID=A0A4W5RGH7_9TELE
MLKNFLFVYIISPPAQLVDKRTLQEQAALLLSVSGQQLSCVQCLLQAGPDPDISSKNKETRLYKGTAPYVPQMVSLILSFGATVNQRCNRGWTALHEELCRDNIEIWYFLYFIRIPISCCKSIFSKVTFSSGADINMQKCDGATALYEASKNGHREIVELLLSPNTDANKPTKTGLLSLHVAAQYGHHDIVYLLVPVTSRARVRHSAISPLHLAAEHNRDMVTAILLKTGANVNATLSHDRSMRYSDHCVTALYFSISNGSTIAAILLAAVRQGCARTVSLLLEHGTDNTSIPFCPTTFPGAIILCMNNLPLLSIPFFWGGGARCSLSFLSLISSPSVCNWAGPIVDLLLDYIGNVQLCARLTELLDRWQEWPSIKTKSSHPLMHLCRLRIREQMGVSRLRSLDSLPLPETACISEIYTPLGNQHTRRPLL